jgi:predicted RNA-binding Zn ribbon-like protein
MTWPDRRIAPGDLETVRAFVNTRDIARGGDALSSGEEVSAWVAGHGLAGTPPDATDAEVRHVRAVREALRAILLANTLGSEVPDAIRVVNEATRRAGLAPLLTTAPELALATSAVGVEAGLGELLAIVYRAIAAGTWKRLKACQACRWAFYDTSRNQRSRWCDMAVCGNRAKQRAYQRRRSA